MRVVHLADYGGPYPGSFAPMLRAVHDAVVQRGWSFEVIFTPIAATRPWYAEMAADGLAVRTAPAEGRRALTPWLREVLDEQGDRPTVLHTHFTRFDLPAVAVARGYPNVRVFWHLHTRLLRGPVAAVRNALKLGIAGRQVEAMLCVSEDIYVAARHRFAPADRLMVFSNAIDLERFRPAATAEERRLARVTLSQSPDRPLLVHFGWDWERKGGDLFLAAVEILLRSGLDVQALCVGGGDSARATSARLGLGDRASVLEPRDDVRTFYAAADVFVSPSQAEGMPYAVLEALCTGTPAVTSDIPSHALLAERTQLCTLAERNPQALALAMRSVLSASSEGRSSSDISELVDSIDLRAWAQRLVALYAEER